MISRSPSLISCPPPQHPNVHKVPPVTLRAIVEGDNIRLSNFLVDIQLTKTIADLKDVIKLKKLHALAGADADQVQIFKVHMLVKDAMAKLHGEELVPADDVSEHWAWQPPLTDDGGAKYVHIVVRGPTSTISTVGELSRGMTPCPFVMALCVTDHRLSKRLCLDKEGDPIGGGMFPCHAFTVSTHIMFLEVQRSPLVLI